jgi:outer membrane biogenesis lipoprotein LolB
MMFRRTVALLMAPVVAVTLAACGEKPQTASGRKTDAKPWEGMAQATHSADGYKAGDKAVWEAQLKARTERGQNEYTHTTTVVKP